MEFRNKTGTNRAVMGSCNGFTLRALPSNIFCKRAADIVKGNITLGVPMFFGRCGRMMNHKMPTPGVLVSGETRVMVSCRVLFSRCRRRHLKNGTFNSAGSKVTPFCSSGCTGVNFRMDRLFSRRTLGRGIMHVYRAGGMALRRLCRGPLLGPRSVVGRLVRCGGVIRPCMYSMSLCL